MYCKWVIRMKWAFGTLLRCPFFLGFFFLLQPPYMYSDTVLKSISQSTNPAIYWLRLFGKDGEKCLLCNFCWRCLEDREYIYYIFWPVDATYIWMNNMFGNKNKNAEFFFLKPTKNRLWKKITGNRKQIHYYSINMIVVCVYRFQKKRRLPFFYQVFKSCSGPVAAAAATVHYPRRARAFG